jgi:RNA polymerase sigma factor (sigma-70 family)
MTDLTELCRRIRAGDTRAEDECYQLLRQHLLPLIRRDRNADAEDVLQETLVKVFRSIRNEQVNPETLLPYAARAARNSVLEKFRRESVRKRHSSNLLSIEEGRLKRSQGANPLDAMVHSESQRAILRAVGTLTTLEADVARRYFFRHESIRQICQELHMTEPGVKMIRWRAVQKLKRIIGDRAALTA